MTVPAELPGTSLICISIFPYKYSFLERKPEPEALSRDRERRWPLLRIWARPSPQVISVDWWKLAAAEERREAAANSRGSRKAVDEAMLVDLELQCEMKREEGSRGLYIARDEEGGQWERQTRRRFIGMLRTAGDGWVWGIILTHKACYAVRTASSTPPRSHHTNFMSQY